jgi:histidinol phosphatase-like enzyme (inositol monophosphatase family)
MPDRAMALRVTRSGMTKRKTTPPCRISNPETIMPDTPLSDLLKAALQITESAAAIPMRYFRGEIAVEDKADETPVTVADKETEEHIRRAVLERFPSHGIYGEEFGRENVDREHTWIIDPIDGTRSFICGVPLFGMLLGVLRDGTPEVGVIHMPALGEAYAGCRDDGATLNGERIRCRTTTALSEARLFINEANLMVDRQPERLGRLMRVGHICRFFNDCYPFALLAAGRIDAVVDFDLKPYDFLPVVPVIEAAGGIVTDWRGGKLGLASDGSIIAAATPELHDAIMAVLA